MTKTEMIKEIKDFLLKNMNGVLTAGIVGLRYDNKNIVESEILENSVSNMEREDSRDFPEYDENSERLNGTCVYTILNDLDYYDQESEIDEILKNIDKIIVDQNTTNFKHCSIVIGNDQVNTIDAEDDGEAIVTNCKVVKVLF